MIIWLLAAVLLLLLLAVVVVVVVAVVVCVVESVETLPVTSPPSPVMDEIGGGVSVVVPAVADVDVCCC